MSSEAVVLLCLVTIEASWLVPWAFVVAPAGRGAPLLPVGVACSVLALATLTASWLLRGAFRESGWQVASAFAGVLVAVIASAFAPGDQGPATLPGEAATVLRDGFGPALLAFLFALLLWVRGASVGASRVGDRGVSRRMVLGVAGLSAAALVAAATAPGAASAIAPAAALFLVAALLASALEGLEYVRTTARTQAAGGFGRGWLTLSTALAVALLALGLAASALAEARGLAIIKAALAPVLVLLELAILALSLPAALVIGLIARLVGPRAGAPRPLPPLLQPPSLPRATPPPATAPPPSLLPAGSLLVAGLVLAVLLVALLVALRHRAAEKPEEAIPEERQSVWSWGQLAEAIRSRRRGRRAPVPAPVDEVRRAYRAFQGLAASRGAVRAPSETPAELEARVAAAHRGLAPPIDALTRAYERVRYGERPPPPDDIRRANDALARIRDGFGANGDGQR